MKINRFWIYSIFAIVFSVITVRLKITSLDSESVLIVYFLLFILQEVININDKLDKK